MKLKFIEMQELLPESWLKEGEDSKGMVEFH